MYNYRVVEQVTRRQKPMTGALRTVMVVFGVFFVILGIAVSQGFMLPGFLLVALYFLYDIFSKKEYEYTLEGTRFSVAVIWGKRYRKEVHSMDLKDLEVVAPSWHERVAKYKKHGGSVKLPKFDYTSYDEDTPYYTMIIMEDRKKIKLLLDLNEGMFQILKQMYPEKVISNNAQ